MQVQVGSGWVVGVLMSYSCLILSQCLMGQHSPICFLFLLLLCCHVAVASTLRQQKRFKRNPEVAQVTDCLVSPVLPEQQQG